MCMLLNQTDKIKLLNSLRNGVPTNSLLDYLITGRDGMIKETSKILDYTSRGVGTFKFITGEYGTGKTFLLQYMAKSAIEENFVVSKLTINKAFRLNKLDDLYYNIMHNLYISHDNSEKQTNFDDIFYKWIQQLKRTENAASIQSEINRVIENISKFNASFGRAFLAYIKASVACDTETKDAASSWLTGESNVPAHLKEKFHVIGKVDKLNMLDFLKAFINLVEFMGYKGLIVLIDEVDLLIDERSDIRLSGYINIKHLLDTLSGGEFGNTTFVFSASSVLFSNEEKGIHSYEALHQRMCNTISKESGNLEDYRNNLIELKNLNLIDYQILNNKIYKLFSSVYDIQMDITLESLRNWVFLLYKKENKNYKDITIRNFISRLIEILDIISQNPKKHIFNTNIEMQLNGSKLLFKSKTLQKAVND